MPKESFVYKTEKLFKSLWGREVLRRYRILISSLLFSLLMVPHLVVAEGIKSNFSGYLKTLNFFTRTSGFVPEFVDNPLAMDKRNANVFCSQERFRLKSDVAYEWDNGRRVAARVDYDNQAYFGSFVHSGDFRVMRHQIENRQFLDLSQTLARGDDAFYEHRLYRATLAYQTSVFDLEVGRQQIPWGVGRFFTPTDLFNPFNPTQIELDERDGVDAANLIFKDIHGYKAQAVYTPNGKQLHPQRYLARVSRDLKGYEVGLLGGRVRRDSAVGFDFAGNIKDSAVRGEFLYREAELEKDFIKFTINADYNFPHNIYALVEYYFNGQGRRNTHAYQWDRFVRGEIQQLGREYLALSLGYDVTPLIRLENRTIMNLHDKSFFERPEIQYEVKPNLKLTAGSQLYLGHKDEEFGSPRNLYMLEGKYNF